MDNMTLKTAHCMYCETDLSDDSVGLLSCECGELAICLDCFNGEDGIKQELGIGDSAVLTPFMVGEGANQAVGGFVDGTSIACKNCVSRRQNVAFTPRRKGAKSAKARMESASGGEAASSASGATKVVAVASKVVDSEGPILGRIEVLLGAVAEAGAKPGELSRLSIWRDIRRGCGHFGMGARIDGGVWQEGQLGPVSHGAGIFA
mmetsp:Transcript_60398/g.124168  ORF Transcript_60398/g.124168 Transcript_60398/m.124168 type:complete len:205 (+) Transcript_60398:748-1362(+)